jgi:hypothetical protein
MTREELIDAIWTEGMEIDRLDDDHWWKWMRSSQLSPVAIGVEHKAPKRVPVEGRLTRQRGFEKAPHLKVGLHPSVNALALNGSLLSGLRG